MHGHKYIKFSVSQTTYQRNLGRSVRNTLEKLQKKAVIAFIENCHGIHLQGLKNKRKKFRVASTVLTAAVASGI